MTAARPIARHMKRILAQHPSRLVRSLACAVVIVAVTAGSPVGAHLDPVTSVNLGNPLVRRSLVHSPLAGMFDGGAEFEVGGLAPGQAAPAPAMPDFPGPRPGDVPVTTGALAASLPRADISGAAPAEAGDSPLTLDPLLLQETPRWYGQLAPQRSEGPNAFIRVHGQGGVYAMTTAGNMRWYRPSHSLYDDWGIPSTSCRSFRWEQTRPTR